MKIATFTIDIGINMIYVLHLFIHELLNLFSTWYFMNMTFSILWPDNTKSWCNIVSVLSISQRVKIKLFDSLLVSHERWVRLTERTYKYCMHKTFLLKVIIVYSISQTLTSFNKKYLLLINLIFEFLKHLFFYKIKL